MTGSLTERYDDRIAGMLSCYDRVVVVLATETFFRPRAICSTCSNQRMWCLPGGAGHQSFCGPKVFTALARQSGATKRLS